MRPPSITRPSMAIVGSGIGGLALAHALTRYGFSVTLVEQADTLSEVGAGVSIWENGLVALGEIGLRQTVESKGLFWQEYEIHRPDKSPRKKDTRILSHHGETAPLMIKRGDLFTTLKETLPSSVLIITGFRVEGLHGSVLKSRDGRELHADVIIGADGVNSVVRKSLTDEVPIFRKQVCFRGIASNISSENWRAAEVFDKDTHRAGYFRLSDDQAYWFDIMDSELPTVDFASVEKDIAAMNPRLAALINKTPKASILCNGIWDMTPVISPHDTITLIGDAAHPMQPSLGQGACLALEDAVVLAKCFHDNDGHAKLAIKSYLSKRKRRWSYFYKLNQQLGTGTLDKGALGRNLAIFRMSHTPEWALATFGRPLFRFKP